MLTGQVKWFDVKKGFGFILGPEGQDVFVHYSAISADGFRTLKDGENVEYELVQGDKGLHAKDVRRLNPPRRPVEADEGGEGQVAEAAPVVMDAGGATRPN